jgi:hypothetical protein
MKAGEDVEYTTYSPCDADWIIVVFIVGVDVVCFATLLHPATAIFRVVASLVSGIRTGEACRGLTGQEGSSLHRTSMNEHNIATQCRYGNKRTKERSHDKKKAYNTLEWLRA